MQRVHQRVFTASSYSACVMKCWFFISSSTMLRCFCASSRFSGIDGSYFDGFFVIIAIVAACTMLSLSAVVLKYRSAAACTPYSEFVPNCAMFR